MKKSSFSSVLSVAILLIGNVSARAQDIKIINVNSKNFPVLEAIIHTHTSGLEQITEYNLTDFTVFEKGENLEILKIENPKTTRVALSVLMVIDISGSMGQERLRIVKDAALNFINQVPLEVSEVAIASFNNEVLVNCDFTQNKMNLAYTLDKIKSLGGTSYYEAFLNPDAGGLNFMERAKNKKVIVFLTDGLSHIDADSVISRANKIDVEIFTISIELPMPESLKEIAVKTGGDYYEAMQSEKEVTDVYFRILSTIQSDLYGKVSWKAKFGCNAERNGKIIYKEQELIYNYKIPSEKVSQLNVDADELNFGYIKPGENSELELKLISANNPVQLNDVKINHPVFTIDKDFDLKQQIKTSEKLILPVSYAPKEEGEFLATLSIFSENCPQKGVQLTGGKGEQIVLLEPHGGELFATGSETIIKWQGIKKDRQVYVSYQLSDSTEWINAGTCSNNTYLWKIPHDTSSNARIKIRPAPVRKDNLVFKHSMDINDYEFESIDIKEDGSKILFASSVNNMVYVCNKDKGFTMLKARIIVSEGACFNKTDKIIGFSKSQVSFHYDESGTTKSLESNKGKFFNSICLSDGSIKTIPSKLKKVNETSQQITSLYSELHDTVIDNSRINYAGITNNGVFAFTLNLENEFKVWNTELNKITYKERVDHANFKLIVSPENQTAIVLINNTPEKILCLATGEKKTIPKNTKFESFSISGSFYISRLPDSSIIFVDSYSGEKLFEAEKNIAFKTYSADYGLFYYQNDTLGKTDLKSGITEQLYSPSLVDFIINPEGTKVLLLRNSGFHSILKLEDFSILTEFQSAPSEKYQAVFIPASEELILATNSQAPELWSPEIKEFEPDYSGRFSIIQPKLFAKDTFFLGCLYTNQTREYQLDSAYLNFSNLPIEINKIEIEGENSTDFDLINSWCSIPVKNQETRNLELRFQPKTIGKKHAILKCYTEFDTLLTHIIAEAEGRPFQLLNNAHNLGKLLIYSEKDTIIPILVNTGSEIIQTNYIQNLGPDTSQINFIHQLGKNIKPGDTLFFQINFTGLRRGITTTIASIKFSSSNELKLKLYGEVVAPKKHVVFGQTFRQSDSLPLKSFIKCTDLESGKNINESESDFEGVFSLILNPDRAYGFFASAPGYLTSSQQIDLTKPVTTDTLTVKMFLTELKPGNYIKLNCIFFGFGNSELMKESFSELNQLVRVLNENPKISITIHGHTDNIGSQSYNYNLARQRTLSVKEFLLKQGIAANRIKTQPWGFDKPLTTNETEAGRAENRRVEIQVNEK
ncbi:MAG: OmpA family protein [Bacteroidales bacterium]|nr:OmpA family protein [Bacteroidales bacterium]MBN2817362.1 OmpA family protein [Bacteroidales bacterium]